MGRVGARIAAAALALALGEPAWPREPDQKAAEDADKKRDEALDEAARDMARAQDKALRDDLREFREQAREDEPGGEAPPPVRQLEGNVAEVSGPKGLTVLDPRTGELLELKVDGRTQIVRGAGPLALDRIREGAEVRASYVLDGEGLRAARVVVSEKGPQPAEIVQPQRGDRPAVLRLQGRITEVSDLRGRFELLDPQRDLAVTIKVVDSTRLSRDGQPVGFESLEPGQEVRALYSFEKNQPIAAEVTILSGATRTETPGGQPAGAR